MFLFLAEEVEEEEWGGLGKRRKKNLTQKYFLKSFPLSVWIYSTTINTAFSARNELTSQKPEFCPSPVLSNIGFCMTFLGFGGVLAGAISNFTNLALSVFPKKRFSFYEYNEKLTVSYVIIEMWSVMLSRSKVKSTEKASSPLRKPV